MAGSEARLVRNAIVHHVEHRSASFCYANCGVVIRGPMVRTGWTKYWVLVTCIQCVLERDEPTHNRPFLGSDAFCGARLDSCGARLDSESEYEVPFSQRQLRWSWTWTLVSCRKCKRMKESKILQHCLYCGAAWRMGHERKCVARLEMRREWYGAP